MFAPVINDHVPGGPDLYLPTDDGQVRLELRKLGEPITLFGEDSMLRRARLGKLIAEQKHTNFESLDESQTASTPLDDLADSESDDEFYTPGTDELLKARERILEYLVPRAIDRVEAQRAAAAGDFTKVLKHRRSIGQQLGRYDLIASHTMHGNTRALGSVRISSDSGKLAAGSWDGSVFVMLRTGEDFGAQTRLAPGYHSEKATVLWSKTEPNLLMSGGAEGTVNIWNAGDAKPKHTVAQAHSGRIAQLDTHPSGQFFCTTSFDQTWKLWDVTKPHNELLEQEGHAKEVYSCSFHPDGSLLALGGLEGIARVWDLRSGRSIAILEGHSKGIYSLDWSPNGYHIASGSGDNSIKIWDMRKSEGHELFTIPAHSKLVSDVRYVRGGPSKLAREVTDENGADPLRLPVAGTFLVSSSFDGTVKLWSGDNWIGLGTLRGHSDKVMSCDVDSGGETVVSSGWDRTVRVWGEES